jgi:hypothetical protein
MTHRDIIAELCLHLNSEDTVREVLLAALDGSILMPTEYMAICRDQGLLLDNSV